jgi:hypothetical protein
MSVRLAYLGVFNAFALLRLLPGSDRDKDAEILTLRLQIAVLQGQFGAQKIRFEPADLALLAGLLDPLPRPTLLGMRAAGARTRSSSGTATSSPAGMRAPSQAARPAPYPALDPRAVHISCASGRI